VSDSVPDVAAFKELEGLVRHLGDELSGFRRRALQSEARVKQLEDAGAAIAALERLETLERENVELRSRVTAAADRTRALLDRVRFLRQQGAKSVKEGER
jgi:hypothetical protein